MSTPQNASAVGGRVQPPGLAVAAVAKRLGVAPPTLRTWDRRYGLGPSGRTAGTHRRYTPEDIARLMVMRQYTLEGVAPGDAARVALDTDAAQLNIEAVTQSLLGKPSAYAHEDQLAEAATTGANPVDGESGQPNASLLHGNSGHSTSGRPSGQPYTGPLAVVPGHLPPSGAVEAERPFLRALPGGASVAGDIQHGGEKSVGGQAPSASAAMDTHNRVSAVIDAALAYDGATCSTLLRLDIHDDPAVWWSHILEPAWQRLAQRTVLAAPGEIPEVVLATAALSSLRQYTAQLEQQTLAAGGLPPNHPSRMRKIVLIFAPPDETLPLSAHALAAAVVAGGGTARIVTGPASGKRAVELVTMVRPIAVVMATMLERPDLSSVAAIHQEYPDLPLLVSVRGDDAAGDIPLAASVQRVRTIQGLVHEVLALLPEE